MQSFTERLVLVRVLYRSPRKIRNIHAQIDAIPSPSIPFSNNLLILTPANVNDDTRGVGWLHVHRLTHLSIFFFHITVHHHHTTLTSLTCLLVVYIVIASPMVKCATRSFISTTHHIVQPYIQSLFSCSRLLRATDSAHGARHSN